MPVLGSPALLKKNRSLTLSFFSLVFLFPWCFSSWEFPWSFGVFSASFTGFLRVRTARRILGVFEVFLGVFGKTKEKKDREGPKDWKKSRSPSGIEIFNRDWNFQASHQPNPYFLWGILKVRDWKFQSRLIFSIEIENFNRDWFFSIFGPLGIWIPRKALQAMPLNTTQQLIWEKSIFFLRVPVFFPRGSTGV